MNKIKVTKEIKFGSGEKLTKLNTSNFWQTFVDVYNEFAAETSIHGLKYTTQRKLKIDGFVEEFLIPIKFKQLQNKFFYPSLYQFISYSFFIILYIDN